MVDSKYYEGISNYNQLNHGIGFTQQHLHWLLHMAIIAKTEYSHDSIEYQAFIARIAQQLSQFANRANFSMEEMGHYDSPEHHAEMDDARAYMKELGFIPFTTPQLGNTFTNVVPDKGNADGDTFKNIQPGAINHPIKCPNLDRPGTGIDTVMTKEGVKIKERPNIAGVSVFNQGRASNYSSFDQIRKKK
jgi:hypothetical protein